jgi:hypothetical protein
MSCTRRRIVLSDIGIFRISFLYSSPNIILKYYGIAIVCGFILLPRFRQRHSLLLELCQKWLRFGPLFSLGCLISYTPFKIVSWFFLLKCDCFMWSYLFSLLGTIAWIASFWPLTTHLGRDCSSPDEINPKDNQSLIYWRTTALELNTSCIMCDATRTSASLHLIHCHHLTCSF